MTAPGSATDVTVVVVGAGISGLTAARELHRRGVDVVVLEAADRIGGRTMCETTALGSTVDLGGQWIGHDHHRLTTLADELGLTRCSNRSAGMRSHGRPTNTSVAVIWRCPSGVPWRAFFRCPLRPSAIFTGREPKPPVTIRVTSRVPSSRAYGWRRRWFRHCPLPAGVGTSR